MSSPAQRRTQISIFPARDHGIETVPARTDGSLLGGWLSARPAGHHRQYPVVPETERRTSVACDSSMCMCRR